MEVDNQKETNKNNPNNNLVIECNTGNKTIKNETEIETDTEASTEEGKESIRAMTRFFNKHCHTSTTASIAEGACADVETDDLEDSTSLLIDRVILVSSIQRSSQCILCQL